MNRTRNLAWRLALMAPLLAVPVRAQEADDLAKELEALLNTKITVASKSAESLNAAPGIVSVISSRELEGYAAQNLGQVMNRVVGMALLSPDIFKDQSVVVRAQETWPYNNHILVLLNGRPMRDPITGGLNGPTWNAFPIALVDHLEIIRGPGSVLYGSCAYSGVVNIVTKTRQDVGFSGAQSVTAGGYGGYGQQGYVTFNSGEFQGMVGANHYSDKGPEFEFADYSKKVGKGFFNREVLSTVVNLSGMGFTLNAARSSYDQFSLDGADEIWKPETVGKQALSHVDLGYSKDINKFLNVGANLTWNKTDWTSGTLASPQLTTANATLFELMARIKPMEGMNVVVGGGAEDAQWNGTGLVVGGSQKSTFFYAQVDYRIQALKLIGGAQYNKLDGIDGNTSPRVGLIYDFTPEWGAKVLYSTAFRKGYPHETGFNVSVFRGNKELKPELVTTTEAQVFYQGKTAQGSITFYKSQQKDLITRKVYLKIDPATGNVLGLDYLKYINGGTADFQGFELEGKASLTSSLMLTGSAYFQKNENEAGVKDFALHPNTMVKVGALYQSGNWSLGVFDAYFGAPKTTRDLSASAAAPNKEAESFHLVSAKVTWKAIEMNKQALRLSLEADNLLNTDIRYPDYANKGVNTLIPLYKGAVVHATVAWNF